MRPRSLPLRKGREQLACAFCGYRFNKPWMQVWLMKAHMEIWHGLDEVHLITVDPNSRPNVPELISMSEAEDITKLLKQLHDVNEETKQVTQEARTALKDLKHELRASQSEIKKMVEDEVAFIAQNLSLDAQSQLRAKVNEVAEEMANRLREKLL